MTSSDHFEVVSSARLSCWLWLNCCESSAYLCRFWNLEWLKEQPGYLHFSFCKNPTTSKSIYKNNCLSPDGEMVAGIFKVNHTAEAQDYQEQWDPRGIRSFVRNRQWTRSSDLFCRYLSGSSLESGAGVWSPQLLYYTWVCLLASLFAEWLFNAVQINKLCFLVGMYLLWKHFWFK